MIQRLMRRVTRFIRSRISGSNEVYSHSVNIHGHHTYDTRDSRKDWYPEKR